MVCEDAYGVPQPSLVCSRVPGGNKTMTPVYPQLVRGVKKITLTAVGLGRSAEPQVSASIELTSVLQTPIPTQSAAAARYEAVVWLHARSSVRPWPR